MFEKSGNIIEQINSYMIKDVLNGNFTDAAKYVELFGAMQHYEVEAFNSLLSS